MDTRRKYRVLFASIIILSTALLAGTVLSAEPAFADFREQAELPQEDRESMAPPRDGITVVTSHLGDGGVEGDIVALSSDGTLMYHNDTHDGYWDVDPSPEGDETVVYAATDKIRDDEVCNPVDYESYCIRQQIERANLTTGEVTVLYSRIDGRYHSSEWHDIDRINDSHYVVADMYMDEVFIVNVETGIVEWEWSVQSYAPLTSGGEYPADWIHLNDVEVLEDGRIMVSLRNRDEIVFVDPNSGVDDDWTLGSEGEYDIVHHQHNPDYIPASQGGPAVVVADSENNRIVEYQRTPDGEWNRTWLWKDSTLQWPRDADRLPNGNMLITDTYGHRVVEVDPQGEVVWTLDVPLGYEAERLSTGPESAGGPSANRAGLESRSPTTDGSSSFKGVVLGLFPSQVVNAIDYVVPTWMDFEDLLVFLVTLGTAITWVVAEVWWSDFGLRNPIIRR